MTRILTVSLLLASFWFSGLFAQEHGNVLNNRQYQWKHVSSKNFDIHYYTPDPVMGQEVAKLAEQSLYEINKLFDYEHKKRFAIHVFSNPYDLINSNQYPELKYKEAGITHLNINSGFIVYPGNAAGLAQKVKTEVGRLLLGQFYFGGNIQLSIQNAVLLHTPDWYIDGLSAYVGEGWTFEDEMRLGGLQAEQLLQYALEGNSEFHRTVRKSIWYYITSQYGPEKISEIFYMTRLTRSVESGIITVLGITLKTLTERWREFAVTRVSANQEDRQVIDASAKLFNLGNKERLLNHAIHPDSNLAAIYIEKNGKHSVSLIDLDMEMRFETGIKGGFKTDQLGAFEHTPPMVFSGDGKYLLAVIFRNGRERLALFDLEKNKVKYTPVYPVLERILSMTWSHDGKQVIVSALNKGQVNLYYHKPGSNQFRQLTKSPWDNLYPIYSMDDNFVYYSSNAGSAKEKTEFNISSYRTDLDLYKLSLGEKGAQHERITSTPGINEIPISFESSFELNYSSDQYGIRNLMRRNVFISDSVALTDLDQGFKEIATNDYFITFSAIQKGKSQFFFAPNSLWLGEHQPEVTQLRKEKVLALIRKESLNTIRINKQGQIEKIKQKEIELEKIRKENKKKDVIEEEEEELTYVFDEDDDVEEDNDPKPRRQQRKNVEQKYDELVKKELLDFNSIKLTSPTRSKLHFAADRVSTIFSFSPVYFGNKYRTLLNILLETSFKDLQNNHEITVGIRPYFFNFKNTDFHLKYTYKPHKLDYFAGFNKSMRWMSNEDFQLRYSYLTAYAGAQLPFNRYANISAQVEGNYIHRRELNLLTPEGLDGKVFLPGAAIKYSFDNTENSKNFTWSGLKFNTEVHAVFNPSDQLLEFVTVKLDARHYTKILKHFVLATRFAAGGSRGNNRQEFALGGLDNWMFSSIQNGAELPLKGELSNFAFFEYVTPVRGFLYNARTGTNYAVANAELRMPISRMVTGVLNANPIYNFELIPFVDIGTIWRQGNPLSQRNPITNEPINSYPLTINVQTLKSPFLIGFGAGMRATIFGYSLRADLAWGMEDNTVLTPKLHLTMGKNF